MGGAGMMPTDLGGHRGVRGREVRREEETEELAEHRDLGSSIHFSFF